MRCRLTFRKRTKTFAFCLSFCYFLKASQHLLCMDHAIPHGKSFNISLLELRLPPDLLNLANPVGLIAQLVKRRSKSRRCEFKSKWKQRTFRCFCSQINMNIAIPEWRQKCRLLKLSWSHSQYPRTGGQFYYQGKMLTEGSVDRGKKRCTRGLRLMPKKAS